MTAGGRRHGVGDAALAGEAWLLLGAMRAMLLVVPFRRLMPVLGMSVAHGESAAAASARAPEGADPGLDRLRWGIDAAARRTPWESKCLAQSLAGATMLRLRRREPVVYFGVRPASAAEGREMTAHSWLVAEGRIVTGEAGHEQYAVVAVYRPAKSRG